MHQLFGITYTPPPAEDVAEDPSVILDPNDPRYENWLYLEQEYIPEAYQYPDYNDVDNMHRRALSGYSARSYIKDDCPIDITSSGSEVLVALTFYVLTSRDDFEYTLETNVPADYEYVDYRGENKTSAIRGRIVDDGLTNIPKGLSTVFPMSDYIDFNHRITGVDYTWESPTLNTLGQPISSPTLTSEGRFLRAEDPFWGVVRLTYQAIAHQHTLVLGVDPRDGTRFKSLTPQIIAHWSHEGTSHSTTLTLEVPQCALDALSTCPDGVIVIVLLNPYKDKYIVYYNTCNGDFMKVCEAGKLKDEYHRAMEE